MVVNRFWTVTWMWKPRRAAGLLSSERSRKSFREFGLFIWDDRLVGPCEWWEYDYNFLHHSSHSLNLCSHTSNTEACAIYAFKTCLNCYLHVAMLPRACHFPHIKASNTWVCEPCHIESKEYDQICTDERFGLQDQKFRQYRFGRILPIWYGTVHKPRCLMPLDGGNGMHEGALLCVDSK